MHLEEKNAMWLRMLLSFFCCLLIPPCFGQTVEKRTIEIVLDASGSMAGRIVSGEVKITAAKRAVSELIGKISGETTVAFRAYGHQSDKSKHDCQDTQLLVPFEKLSVNRDRIKTSSQGLQPKGYTPITYVLKISAEDFPASLTGEKVILLISDGKETCQGDPCATARTLAKMNPKWIVHTIGFGVDEAARSQLECIARATGGSYFGAEDFLQLLEALQKAIVASAQKREEKKGEGKLTVKRADFSGHKVTNAETGEMIKTIDSFHDTIVLPAGLYHVSFGNSLWKSVEVRAGETTILTPAILNISGSSLHGQKVIDPETEEVQGEISSSKSVITLMPGHYLVMFGKVPWEVDLKAGTETLLQPGTVTVKRAHINGHSILDTSGQAVGSVSATGSSIPLPPGSYTLILGSKRLPFTLKAGENKIFENN